MAQFNRERVPERVVHAKGSRRPRLLRGHRGRLAVHEGGPLQRRRQEDADARALLHGRRRARLARHAARPARLRAEVLHAGGQLRPRRQQHAGLLRPRPVELPGLHPLPEAPRGHRPPRQQHAVGLLDAEARVRAPGHDPHERPRNAEDLSQHGRLRQPHVHVGQRGRRAVLDQVPLQDRPGRQELHRRRGRRHGRGGPRLPPRRPVGRDRGRRTRRRGRCTSRSCRSTTRRTTASTRST